MGRHGDLEPVWLFGETAVRTGTGRMVYAVDADTGAWKWRLKSNYPIVSGMPPTAVGVVFFGDLGGNFMRSTRPTARSCGPGARRRDHVITYTVNGAQEVAVAAGLRTSPGQPRS